MAERLIEVFETKIHANGRGLESIGGPRFVVAETKRDVMKPPQ
jgi:hypothetical protein